MSAIRRCCILLCAAILLTSCEEEGTSADADSDAAPDLLADERAACERGGGRWGTHGSDGLFVCFETTRDAHKGCLKASDCDSLCLARSRTCAPVKPFLGCHETLTEAGLPATVCRN